MDRRITLGGEMRFLEQAYTLLQTGEPFALVTVVRAEKPTSAKPGAKAIVSAEGELTGWVGGSCAEPTVIRAARQSLEDGQTRLVRLCPPEKCGQLPQEGVTEVTMTCISGGTLEIYIEPQLAQPDLLVVGHLATAQALVRLAKALDFPVTVMGLEADKERFPQADHVFEHLDFSKIQVRSNTSIVVASHGNYDEEALEGALRSNAAYVALISSKTRAQALLQYLHDSNLPAERVAQLKYPAGLDIGAVTPEEIALSILAEIVQRIHRSPPAPQQFEQVLLQIGEPASATDPVCGMTVEIASARYVSQHEGKSYYFCARGCQRSFEQDPGKYLTKESDRAI
jgi:xanthine dehydrogenase accessory factor